MNDASSQAERQSLLTRAQNGAARRIPLWISPNMLTFLRLLAAAGILLAELAQWHLWWIVGLGFVAAWSDFFDGAVARLRNQTSKLGAFLDPMGDKVLALIVGWVLWRRGLAGGWLLAGVILVESHSLFMPVMVMARRVRQGNNLLPLPKVLPNMWGKVKTGLNALGMGVTLIGGAGEWPPVIAVGLTLVWIAIGLGVAAIWQYVRDFRRGMWA